ncbi:hypothetical protein ACFPK5_17785 [Streptomyces beijiangensis]
MSTIGGGNGSWTENPVRARVAMGRSRGSEQVGGRLEGTTHLRVC